MSEPLDPEDETFWKQVREGYNQVCLNPELVVDVRIGIRQAVLQILSHEEVRIINISITEVPLKAVELVSE